MTRWPAPFSRCSLVDASKSDRRCRISAMPSSPGRAPPGPDPVVTAFAGSAQPWSLLPLHDLLLLLAQPIDAERHHVAGFQERRRLHAEPDARRCAGDDDVARLQDEILRAAPDDVAAVEDHGRGVAALAFLAVDVEPHVQFLRILDLVLGDEPRAERAEGFAAFALGPLAGALDLEHALGDVVGQAIAGDDVERLVLAQVAGARADDNAELDFPIELGGIPRDDGVVVRAAQARRRLVEDDRLLRNRHAGFGSVVGIVQPDGDEIAHPADARPDPWLALHQRQLFRIELFQLGEVFRRQRLAGEIGNDFRQVANLALGVDHAGLFAAGGAVTNEFHGGLLGVVIFGSSVVP